MNVLDLENGSITPDFQLASLNRKYYLTIEGDDIEIPKPDGWTGLDKSFQRDLTRHGFLFEGAENAVIKLHQDEGKQEVEEQYELFGQDAVVYIKETVTYDGVESIQWNGRLDFNKFRYSGNSIELGIEKSSVQNTIQSRWETNVAMSDTQSIDGESITSLQPVPKNVSMHSKSLTLSYVNKKSRYENIDWISFKDMANDMFISFNTNNPEKKEIQQTQEYPAGLTILSPLTEQRYNINASYSGNYNFNMTVEFYFDSIVFGKLAPRKFKNYKMEFVLNINGLEVIMDSYSSPLNQEYEQINKTFSFAYNQSHYVQKNDKIYYYCRFNTQYTGTQYDVLGYWTNINTSFEITASTVSGDSIGYGFDLVDSLDFVVQSISNKESSVYSDFYNGCSGKKLLTSGKALRYVGGVSTIDKPTMTTSLSEIIKSLTAIDGIGMGYEYNGTQEILRVEDRAYFYQDVEVISLDEEIDMDTYDESVATDLIFSEVLVGYSKYPKEDTYGLDEFNTEHSYQTPIRFYKNTLDLRSSLIASGYIIEKQRRNLLTDDTLASTDYDDDNFIICVTGGASNVVLSDIEINFRKPYQFTTEEEDIGGGQIISVQVPIDPLNTFLTNYGNQMNAGSTIVVTGTTDNNKTFNVISTEYIDFLNTWLVTVFETVEEEYPVICDIELASVGLASEKNIGFITTNIADPSTSYNLRINPKYNLLNHATWINSFLRYKQGNEKILCKKVIQNQDFTISRDLNENCVRFDDDRATYKAKEDILLNDFNNRDTIFSPERITFTARLQPEQIKYIVNCHRGIISNKKYGYITFKNPKGQEIQGWLEKITELEQGMETKVEFVLIKKKT